MPWRFWAGLAACSVLPDVDVIAFPMGTAFFWPFSDARYFLPRRPILVSPVTIPGFFHERAFRILGSGFLWAWRPTSAAYAAWRLARHQWRAAKT